MSAPWAVVAEFDTPDALLAAARQARQAGYRHVEAYSPFPVEGLADALDFHRTWVPQLVLAGGVLGGLGGYLLQYWVSVVAYPLNVGGRPFNSWPMFVPVTFEMTVLVAGLTAVIGMLALNGLPRPHHPVFETPGFTRATADRFFLVIEARDPRFEERTTVEFLHRLRPLRVSRVPA